MTRLAEAHGKMPIVRLVIVPGPDHDEGAMAIPAQEILDEGTGRRRLP